MLVLGVEAGWNFSLLLCILLAATGAFVWLRDFGRSRVASALGAVAFGLSGPFVAWLGHPHTLSAAPTPLLLFCIRRLVRRPTRGAFLGLVGATFLVLAGGHPETCLMVALLSGTVVLFEGHAWGPRLRPVVAAILGAGLAAPFIVPFAEYLSVSNALEDRAPYCLTPATMIRFLVPKAAVGHPVEGAATVSLVALILALIALVTCHRLRVVRFWAGLAAVLFLLAYTNPVARFLADHTPVHWSRVLLFMPLALGVLSSAGLDHLRSVLRIHVGETWILILGCALVATAAGELLTAGRGVHAVTAPEEVSRSTPLLDRLLEDAEPNRVLSIGSFLTPNLATTYGLDDLRGYDSLNPSGWRRRRNDIGTFRLDMMSLADLQPGGEALDYWNVKYLLVAPDSPWSADAINARRGLDLEEVYSGPDGRIWRNRRALPRARLTAGGQVAVERRSPTAWRLRVDAATPTTLVIANPYFPGWRTYVDGCRQALRALPGDPMEVPVPGGRHRVDLVYEPASFRIGLAVAALCFLAVAAIALVPPRAWKPLSPAQVL